MTLIKERMRLSIDTRNGIVIMTMDTEPGTNPAFWWDNFTLMRFTQLLCVALLIDILKEKDDNFKGKELISEILK